jgi:hypothetical protein
VVQSGTTRPLLAPPDILWYRQAGLLESGGGLPWEPPGWWNTSRGE